MCGILGVYVKKPSIEIAKNLLKIYKNQKSRGNDGCGILLMRNGEFLRRRDHKTEDLFTVDNLDIWGDIQRGDIIFIHHRFPTTGGGGEQIEANHPFLDEKKQVGMIHNGCLYNDWELYRKLIKEGHTFESEITDGYYTDSEVLVHLLEGKAKDGIKRIHYQVLGSMAIAFVYEKDTGFYLYRNENPITTFRDKSSNFYFASEPPKKVKGLRDFVTLKDRKLYRVENNQISIVMKMAKQTYGKEAPKYNSRTSSNYGGYAFHDGYGYRNYPLENHNRDSQIPIVRNSGKCNYENYKKGQTEDDLNVNALKKLFEEDSNEENYKMELLPPRDIDYSDQKYEDDETRLAEDFYSYKRGRWVKDYSKWTKHKKPEIDFDIEGFNNNEQSLSEKLENEWKDEEE